MHGGDNPFSMTLGGTLDSMPARRPPAEDAHFDITAMIDLVFMMNIYFLFVFIGGRVAEIELPVARHAAALEGDVATVITVLNGNTFDTVDVYVGDGKEGSPISDPDEQTTQVQDAITKGVAAGKTAVLIKAESNVRLGHLKRLCAVAADAEVTLHLAVLEKDDDS